nr:hypothetical protein CKG001_23390 [Bdellovibrio sp. CKG001]
MNIEKVAALFTIVSIGVTFTVGTPALLSSDKKESSVIQKVNSPETPPTSKVTKNRPKQKENLKSQRVVANQELPNESQQSSRSESDQVIIDRVKMGFKNEEYPK